MPHLNRLVIELEAGILQLGSHDDLSKKVVAEFKKQESVTRSDFKTAFTTQASSYPVGQEPLLVTSIQLTPDGKGSLRIDFKEKMLQQVPRGFHMTMPSTLLHGFTHLLESAIQVSEWGIHEPQKTTADAADSALEESRPSDPPTYLN